MIKGTKLILSSHQRQSITLECARTTIIYLSLCLAYKCINVHLVNCAHEKASTACHFIIIFTFRIMAKVPWNLKSHNFACTLALFLLFSFKLIIAQNMIHKTRVSDLCTWEIIIHGISSSSSLGLYSLTWPLSLWWCCKVMVIRAHSSEEDNCKNIPRGIECC